MWNTLFRSFQLNIITGNTDKNVQLKLLSKLQTFFKAYSKYIVSETLQNATVYYSRIDSQSP